MRSSPRGRKLLRPILAIGIVTMAAVIAPRVPLDFAANVSFPEIRVALSLPASATGDPTDVTTRWVVPIESAIRSVGDVVATRGQIQPDGATLTVRFRTGVSPELKTARLLSELAPLRRSLPREARLGVWPSLQSGARPTLVLALSGPSAADAATRISEELRTATGVRDIRTWGARRQETAVRLRRSAPADITPDAVLRAILDARAPHRIGIHVGSSLSRGETSRSSHAVLSVPSANRIEDVLVRGGGTPLRLASIADISTGYAEREDIARINGREAVVVSLFRDEDVPLFRFDASVRSTLRESMTHGVAVEETWNETAELRSLFRAFGIGVLLSMIVLGIAGWLAGGIRGLWAAVYLPLAIALFVLMVSTTSMRVDAQALIAAAIAIAGASPLALRRSPSYAPAMVFCGFALLLPIAVTFGSGALAPFLRSQSMSFLIAAVAAAVAAMIVPPIGGVPAKGLWLRRLIRNSAGSMLATAGAACLLLTWFGGSLDPRASGRSPERLRLYAQVTLPRGSSLEQTSAAIDSVERALRNNRDIDRFWSIVTRGSATTWIDLKPFAASDDHTTLIQILRASVGLPPGMLSIDEQFDSSTAMRMSADVEEQAETDDEATFYRVVLKSANIDTLQRAFEGVAARFQRAVRRNTIAALWGTPTRRIELVPRPGTSAETARELAQQIAQRSIRPSATELPDKTLLRVLAADAPSADDEVARSEVLLNMPLITSSGTTTALAAFNPQAAFVLGSVEREVGRFVLPVSIAVPGMTADVREKEREKIDASASTLPLPADTSMARPALSAWHLSLEKIRMIAMAAFVPLLLFTAAAIALNSTARALVALAPAGVSIACVAPVLMIAHAPVDEMVLLAIAAALCCGTALVTLALMQSDSNGAAYRALRSELFPSGVAAIVSCAILLTPGMTSAALRNGWRGPLVAAVTVLIVINVGGHLVASSLAALGRDARRRLSRETHALRRPAAWNDAERMRPQLVVRNVTKIYGSGFRALHRVSFAIEPGIIGLLGPNGAGKTTLLRILSGLLLPTRGEVCLQGVVVRPENLPDYRRLIGFLPQEFNAYAAFTAEQFLDFWAIERGMTNAAERAALIEELLIGVGLTAAANRRVRDFSGGMRQRIGIARALIGDPPLLIVDEPTTGLDIEARARFRSVMRTVARNRIVILSTHIASDVEASSSRILLLHRGMLRYDGATEQLLTRAKGRVFETVVSDVEARELTRMYRVTTRVRVVSGIRIRAVVPPGEALAGVEVDPTLEEAYLAEVVTDRARPGRVFASLSELRQAQRA